MPVRYIIAGSRNFQNYSLMEKTLNSLNLGPDDEIVSGDARGADTLGAEYGTRHGIPVIHFPAQWDTYGKAAGFIRNEEMAEYGDYLVVFWDGVSRGTAQMIQAMKRKGKHGKVVFF